MGRKRNDVVLSPLEDGNQKYAIRSNADFVVLTGGTGSGKLQPLDSLVLTRFGWKKMGNIQIGDELFSPLNTEPSIVTGIYPHGVKPIYRLTTSDGRSAECGLEHLWMIRTKKQVEKYRKGCRGSFVKTTKEIIDEYLSKGRNVYLPVAHPYDGMETDLPIDPYVLGVWLGDGCCHSASLSISNDEEDIIKKVSEKLSTNYAVHGKYSYTNNSTCG